MNRYIIALDQSTSASKAMLLNKHGQVVVKAVRLHTQSHPAPGRVEHNAQEIWENVVAVLTEVIAGVNPTEVSALALCNQRETTVVWERASGRPIAPAIVWQDTRGGEIVADIGLRNPSIAPMIQERTGLQLSVYYTAAKAASILRDIPDALSRACAGEIYVGTMDSYLLFRLTGAHRTDVTNASRTQLMNLRTLSWDPEICAAFGIPMGCLPQIYPSDSHFGETVCDGLPYGLHVIGVMGDSQAAFFAHGCTSLGMAKATFGTGSSVMLHVGNEPISAPQGLSVSVGYGFGGKTAYVLEGNIISSGDTLCWLRDELAMIHDIREIESLAASVPTTQGVYLVPAFSGLGAPHYAENARALICGMTRGTNRAHVVRAALESIVYQERDVLDAMRASGTQLTSLRADGGLTCNALLMQLLADVMDCPVQCAAISEMSMIGVGLMAGLTVGLYQDLHTMVGKYMHGSKVYQPSMDAVKREEMLNGWREAVARVKM
ncbi:MAG: glycerol kinase GlpK [Clostridia bacterium]|nr:glycerol kinase GlpK [Clostridia bacterium]